MEEDIIKGKMGGSSSVEYTVKGVDWRLVGDEPIWRDYVRGSGK